MSLPSGLSDISEQDTEHLKKASEVEILLGRVDLRQRHSEFLN